MSRRRRPSAAQMPECLRRLDWREWRPPAPPDHPCRFYVEWYLALADWRQARDAWLAGVPVLLPPERPLPDPIPYTGLLPACQGSSPEGNRVAIKHSAHPIKLH
ncbi:hypothetical protein [Streptomyces sp. B21-101]|uniref:hypothetical protein n=1 Tax=Streptomyces sp. B21-101 TaxID=3039415 RepID=UPI002FF0AC43